MRSKKFNWRFYLSLVIIIAFSWIESQYVSESTSLAEGRRHVLHILFLGGVTVTGYWYWRYNDPHWMKTLWLIAYSTLFTLLLIISFLSKLVSVLGTTFLDQVGFVRVFFTSPLPFILAIVLSGIDFRQFGSRDRKPS